MQFMVAINFHIHIEMGGRRTQILELELELQPGQEWSRVLHLANMSVHNLCAIF